MNSRNRSDTLTFSGVVHCIATCDEPGCGWECQNYINGLGQAKIHHNRTGHTVRAEIASGVLYTLEDSAYMRKEHPEKFKPGGELGLEIDDSVGMSG